MPDKTKVSYYVPTPLARAIKMLAVQDDRTQSEVAEDALETYVSERQEDIDWRSAAEGGFDFWENSVDAAYDDI